MSIKRLVGPKAEERGDEDSVRVLRIVVLAAEVDLGNLGLLVVLREESKR